MSINITININYTQQALDVIGTVRTLKLSYAAGIPFPEVGDHIETQSDSGVHPLKVTERLFSMEPGAMQIRLLLDLP